MLKRSDLSLLRLHLFLVCFLQLFQLLFVLCLNLAQSSLDLMELLFQLSVFLFELGLFSSLDAALTAQGGVAFTASTVACSGCHIRSII